MNRNKRVFNTHEYENKRVTHRDYSMENVRVRFLFTS